MKKIYTVEYTENGEEGREDVEARNPGQAFYFMKLRHPEAKLVRCVREGWYTYLGSDRGITEWEAPKNQQMPSANQRRKKKSDQLTFSF